MVGLADQGTGDERVVLVVAPAPGTSAVRLRAALRRRLPELLDAAWLPDDVVVVPALPRAGRAGKVDKAALRAGLADGTVAGLTAGGRSGTSGRSRTSGRSAGAVP